MRFEVSRNQGQDEPGLVFFHDELQDVLAKGYRGIGVTLLPNHKLDNLATPMRSATLGLGYQSVLRSVAATLAE